MVGKVSEKVLAREGLERTDNGMKQSTWPEVVPINQKNYYTDYMKRDDQILALRLQSEANRDKLVQTHRDRDRALSKTGQAEVPPPLGDDDGPAGPDVTEAAHIIVIHPGSQNLRIGLASDALPKTIPMAIAMRYPTTESDDAPARPVRDQDAETLEEQFGEEWSGKYQKMCDDLRLDMRANKRKLPPNPKEQVLNFNRRVEPEVIPQHNDPLQIEWTDPKRLDEPGEVLPFFIGTDAQRVPDDSDPKFRLVWPVQLGCFNEAGYSSREQMFNSFESLLDKAIRHDLGIPISQLNKYNCLFVIPDLYDKRYVEQMLRSCTSWFEFNRVSFMQESLAATFGAGYTHACVVDVGAQKTSVACVEDGACVEDSRINLKYGGRDVTETFVKMMLYDNFPYHEINLLRRYDFLLAEELKIKHCTMSQAEVSPGQPQQFHVRAPNKPTHKYQFKMFDEVILAPMGFYEPSIFDNSAKLVGRRKLLPVSANQYDVDVPDDPTPAAQIAILALVNPSIAAVAPPAPAPPPPPNASLLQPELMSTPAKEKTQPFTFSLRYEMNGTPSASGAPSPARDGTSTPVPAPFAFSAGSPAPNGAGRNDTPGPSSQLAAAGAATATATASAAATTAANGGALPEPVATLRDIAAERDSVLPIAPLDQAIMISINHAARGDDKRVRDFLGTIMVVGGGAKIPHFTAVLEERLRALRPDLADRVLVGKSARDMDEQVVVWKGASVFAKLPTNDSWVTPHEVERLGSRCLWQRLMFNW